MKDFTYKELAEFCVNKYPCDVDVSINPNMYLGGRSKGKGAYIQGLGTFNKKYC